MDSNNELGQLLIDFCSQNEIHQHIKENTRESSILDLVFTKPKNLIENYNISAPFSTSDHNMISFILNIYILETKFTTNDKYNNITQNLVSALNYAIPLQTLNLIIKNSYPKKIKILQARKLAIHQSLRKNPINNNLKLQYRFISKELKKNIESYNEEKISQTINKGGNAIHKLIRQKFKLNNKIPNLISEDNKIHINIKDKCKLLANTFSKYFQLKEFDKNFTPRQTTREHLEDIEFDILTVENILENLPNKNSNSPDDIPYILLKSCSKILSPTITEIFRIILDNRTIPEIWRQSYIIPIFKKGEINDPANYRPISVTCTLCRVFERIISTQIINFLNKTKFFSDEQFGFLQYRSTTTNLLSMLDDFYKSLEKRENIDVIYIDFAKAFDSVPIELLLLKIKACGINGKLYDFIENFLTKRSFKVKIEKEFSESIQTKSGVPQGSVLGPLLFLIFINDLPNYLPSDVKIKIYADDVKLYTYHQNDNRRDILKESLILLSKWAKINGLEIAENKCSVLYVGKNNSQEKYHISENLIPKLQTVRDLGILIDSKLSFSDHINIIIKRAYLSIYRLFKVIRTRKLEQYINIYKTYIRPQLEYASEVWNPMIKANCERLEKIQKYFTKIAFKKSGFIKIKYEERLKICNIEKLAIRRQINDLCMIQKILYQNTHLKPENFFAFAKKAKRKPLLLQNQRYNSKSRNNFFIRNVTNWNKLPNEIMGIMHKKPFRKYIKKWISDNGNIFP
uniref:Reverse transcriptase domain-containing protein n=1 Tax=Meloidogyne enterolobii TaxID=390850 RepID=A0A6V7WDP5_MELEN|nr:unnamed protein product [Meloidogyne enterolobii]